MTVRFRRTVIAFFLALVVATVFRSLGYELPPSVISTLVGLAVLVCMFLPVKGKDKKGD